MRERVIGRQGNKGLLMVIIVALLIAIVVIIIAVTEKRRQHAEIAGGIDYIQSMEGRDTAEIENAIFESSRKKILQEMQENLQQDPEQVWKLLSDLNTVMMGDSRVVGYDVFGFMDESHVLAEGGATIDDIPKYYETLKVLNPGILVLSYGVNDINSYWIWETEEEYLAELNEIMETLTQMLPGAFIYVQSTIPVAQAGIETSPNWANIPARNEAVRETCIEHGWRYLDITDIVDEHWEMHDADGVHMAKEFYIYWAEAILLRYLEDSGA